MRVIEDQHERDKVRESERGTRGDSEEEVEK